MRWDDFFSAWEDAKRTAAQADRVVQEVAELLVGRLHKCHACDLAKIKRELQSFDARSGEWRS